MEYVVNIYNTETGWCEGAIKTKDRVEAEKVLAEMEAEWGAENVECNW